MKKKSVTILCIPGTVLSLLGSSFDIFSIIGVTINRIRGIPDDPKFKVQLASENGQPVTCSGGIQVTPHKALHDIDRTDLVMIPGVRSFFRPIEGFEATKRWLKDQYSQGAHLASICTGAFFLAETGLLDGKTATTHWAAADFFRQRYRKVRLVPKRIITDEGDLFCSGGANAGLDLCFYLVGKYCGRQVAAEHAKSMVYDLGREHQNPYQIFNFQRYHKDEAILEAQEVIEKNYKESFSVEKLSKQIGMSQRTFERRFKSATGDTPSRYLQRVRVEAAKNLLETSTENFEQITFSVGYEDVSSFRRLFVKQTGISPNVYRQHFSFYEL